jgi:hypothetical protein
MLKREKNHIIASKYGCEDSVFACILHAQGQKFSEKRYETLTPPRLDGVTGYAGSIWVVAG